MDRRPRTLLRIVSALASIGALGAFAGCTDSTGPAHPVSPSSIIIIGGRAVVFNAVLRAIGNPNEQPSGIAEGHLQLKLTGSAVAGYVIDWKVDPGSLEREGSRPLGGGIYLIQDSEDFPSPEDVALVFLIPPENPLSRIGGRLEGSVEIPADLAARLVEDPDFLTAVFFLDDGTAIAGKLQLGGGGA